MTRSAFNEWSYPVAKKEHRCRHCLGKIIPGEKHRKFAGVWEGDFQDWRVHEDCAAPQTECQDEYGALCEDKHKRGMSCKKGVVA